MLITAWPWHGFETWRKGNAGQGEATAKNRNDRLRN
nr:MAG TPA: hypothetical protein [Caudoviricetes sp.]